MPLDDEPRGIQLPGFNYGPTRKPKDVSLGPESISVSGPFSMLHRKFSREAKEKRKIASYGKQVDYEKQIRAKYNQAVVINLTGLPEDKVEEFMDFCKLSDAFLGPASEYEIALAVNKCLVEFNATTPLDTLPEVKGN